MENLAVIILAAGQGTRMKSKLPKVLHQIVGKPLLSHVLGAARLVGAKPLVVVVGHGAEMVQQACAAADVSWAMQEQQLGTGHAVRCA